MTPPYRFRLLTVILGHEVELARFHRPVYPSDEAFWTDGLTTPWWWERPMKDSECITSRPHIKPARRTIPYTMLKPEENLALEAKGLVKEYKL